MEKASNFFLAVVAIAAGISFLGCLDSSYVLAIVFPFLIVATIILLKRAEKRNSQKLLSRLN